MASNLLAMASNLLSNGLQPNSNGLQPTSNGLQPNYNLGRGVLHPPSTLYRTATLFAFG